jgi:hypothetical protein
VCAVLVGGSVARGCADRFSDIEIGVFWNELPSANQRDMAREQAGGVPGEFIPNSARFDSSDPRNVGGLERYYLGGDAPSGLLIEVAHETTSGVEQCLDDVVERYDTTLSKQELIAVIQYGVPLFGLPLIERWRARAATYPDELARQMVREHLRVGPWGRKELYAERGEDLIVYEDCCHVGMQMLLALMGLNRMYAPSDDFKWMDRTAAAMQVAPPDCAARMRAALRSDPPTAVRRLRDLMEETIALVEAHMPEIDTKLYRSHLAAHRSPWDRPPDERLHYDMEDI